MMRKRITRDTRVDKSVIDLIQELALKRRRHIRMSVRLTNSIKGAIRVHKGVKDDDGYVIKTDESEELGDSLIGNHLKLCVGGKASASDKPDCIGRDLWFQIDHHFLTLCTFKIKIKEIDAEIEKLAGQLPHSKFVEDKIPGIALLSYGLLIGVTGNLSNYSTPAKVWKRLGLAPITKDGVTQAGSTWRNPKTRRAGATLTDEEWIAAGYSPQRRSLIWNMGAGMLRAGLRKKKATNAFTKLYVERKAASKKQQPNLSDKAHHLRAQRAMEKHVVKKIWQLWRSDLTEKEKADIAKSFKRQQMKAAKPVKKAKGRDATKVAS